LIRSVEEERRHSRLGREETGVMMPTAAPRRRERYRHVATTGRRENQFLGCVSGYALMVVFAAAAMCFTGLSG
jgi:hypothetical protein